MVTPLRGKIHFEDPSQGAPPPQLSMPDPASGITPAPPLPMRQRPEASIQTPPAVQSTSELQELQEYITRMRSMQQEAPTLTPTPVPQRTTPTAKIQQPPSKTSPSLSNIARMSLTRRDGGSWGEVYMVSPGKKVSTEKFEDALIAYQQKNRESIKRGAPPNDIIGDIRISPTSSLMGAAETGYQQYARPFIQESIKGIFPEPLQEPIGQPVSEFMTPETVPQAGAMAASIVAPAALGTMGAPANYATRLGQRAVAGAFPALTYGALEEQETGKFPGSTVAMMASVNFLAQYLTSKIAVNLAERSQRKMETRLMRTMQTSATVDPVTGQVTHVYKNVPATIREMLQTGYDALNDTLEEDVIQLTNMLQTRGGISIVHDAPALQRAVTSSVNLMRQFLRAAPGADISPLRASLQRNLDTISQNIEQSFTGTTTIPRRIAVLGNMVSHDAQLLRQFERYVQGVHGLDRVVYDMYVGGRTNPNIQNLLQRTGATRQQFDLASERVWQRITNGFRGDLTAQFRGVLDRDVAGIAQLDILKQAGLSGDFSASALQKVLLEKGQELTSKLNTLGQQVGSSFYGPAQTSKDISNIAFRGATPATQNIDVTQSRLAGVRVPLPFTDKRFPLGLPLGKQTSYGGSLGIPTITPLEVGIQAPVQAGAVRALSERETQ